MKLVTEYQRKIPNWHEYFFNMIDVIKTRSKDPRTQVGCVIVGEDHEILSTGYNSLPTGVCDIPYESNIDRFKPETKLKYMAHAEQNAIHLAARNGVKLKGSTIYIDFWPCCDCARAIIQAGIHSVIINGKNYEETLKKWKKRWEESMKSSLSMMEEARLVLNIYRNNKLDKYFGNFLSLLEEK